MGDPASGARYITAVMLGEWESLPPLLTNPLPCYSFPAPFWLLLVQGSRDVRQSPLSRSHGHSRCACGVRYFDLLEDYERLMRHLPISLAISLIGATLSSL